MTPMTPTPLLLACRSKGSETLTPNDNILEICVINKHTHLELAAHTLVGFDEPILVIHHDAVLVFTFGVITKSDRNAFVLK